MGRKTLIDRYANEEFEPPAEWDRPTVAKLEIERLRRMAFVGVIAYETPRRLGTGVPSELLAGDKFLARSFMYLGWESWRRMMNDKHGPIMPEELGPDEQYLYPPESIVLLGARAIQHEEAAKLGKTVLWDVWWDDEQALMEERRSQIARLAQTLLYPLWTYKLVDAIDVQLGWAQKKWSKYEKRYGPLTWRP